MAVRSTASRYQNYGYPTGEASSSVQHPREDSPRPNLVAVSSSCSVLPAVHAVNGCQQQQHESEVHPSASSRLEYIINAMAYIRGELVSLK